MPIVINGDSPNFTTASATTLTGVTTLNSSSGVLATQNAITGIPKAWVNFNGSTSAIRGSFNVSSITRNSTGNYTINFTTAMPNANYSFQTGYGDATVSGTVLVRSSSSYFTTGSLRIETVSTTAAQDVDIICVSISSP